MNRPPSSSAFAPEASGPLFIFELANNHLGNVEHGRRIIRELAAAALPLGGRCAVKFQYRHLDTFIHPDFRARQDIKYVKRFQETRLSDDEFKALKDEAAGEGFLTVCTAFDEASVDLAESHGHDFLKVASCSLTDWPLLERLVRSARPIIASVGGGEIEDIDRVVSFFEHRNKDFALMHCVAEYPTPDALLNLNQIDLLRGRYPSVPVGFSTHERPELLDAVKLAVAKRARLLERHVGIATEKNPLNAYSSTPAQAAAWVQAALSAGALCGQTSGRAPTTPKERSELHALRRGVFARTAIKRGERITADKVSLAIPTGEGQFTANDFSKYAELRATCDLPPAAAVTRDTASMSDQRAMVHAIVKQVRDFVRASKVNLPSRADVEISHHYGLERFARTGAVILNFVNRSYCKKALVMLPGQSHPEHAHKVKEETFFVLWGSMKVVLNGSEQSLETGDSILIEPGMRHSFSTTEGVVFEEVSSMHVALDSFYTDPTIMANAERKTYVTYWMD